MRPSIDAKAVATSQGRFQQAATDDGSWRSSALRKRSAPTAGGGYHAVLDAALAAQWYKQKRPESVLSSLASV